MASTKTRIKPIRIANETADYFEGKPLNRMVESIHHLLERGDISFDGEEIKISGGVYSPSIINTMNDIEEMALCFGITLEEMAGQFCEMLNDGSLVVEGGVLMSSEDGWVKEFKETCHDMCIPEEKAGESVVKALRKGQI